MYESSGSYNAAFVMCAVLAVAAAGILLPVKPLYWLEMRGRMRAGTETAADE
jgi:hypothetical protein